MPPKTKSTAKTVKTTVKKVAAKAKPAVKKTTAKARSTAKPAAKKPSVGNKKPKGIIQRVKRSVQTGIEAIGGAVKSITPDALLPKSAKSKRK